MGAPTLIKLSLMALAQAKDCPPCIMPHHIGEEYLRFRNLIDEIDSPENQRLARDQAVKLAGWILRWGWENRGPG